MPNNTNETILTDANRIIETWSKNRDFSLGSIKLADFRKQRDAFVAASTEVAAVRNQLTGLIGERDDHGDKLTEFITRARSGIRANYGPDSAQYKQAGGTRQSERKRPRRAGLAEVVPVTYNRRASDAKPVLPV